VVEALTALVDGHGVRRIVLAGEPRNVAVFRQELPPRLAAFIVGIVAGAQHEGMDLIVARAAEYLPHVEGQREAEGVDGVLTAAAKHGKAAAGLDATLEAVNRGAVHRLYLLKGWSMPGRRCDGCGTLQHSFAWTCPACGGEAETLELGEAMADRVVAAGGTVETIEVHQPLAAAGGVAAELRYPL
jgi:stalled ribosome rescue protein Dom34